ncbi:MAG: flavodoxin family protein [Oscillospiraceae bacterium]|nr:flavodoxin family protein [Oscillospiraceae bacterium]
MKKKVVILSTSPRKNGNSNALAEQFAKGAADAGNEAEIISLIGKQVGFCRGCFACQTTGTCVIKDDAIAIEQKVLEADVVVWATPIYYYEMSGQMKVLIDRLNPLFPKDYKFREVYLLAAAAEDEDFVPQRALEGLKGWVDCFERAEFAGFVFCGGVTDTGDIKGSEKLREAYEMGKNI